MFVVIFNQHNKARGLTMKSYIASCNGVSDIVVRAASAKEAKEYVSYRMSSAYGFKGASPARVRVSEIDPSYAEDLIDSGAVDWHS